MCAYRLYRAARDFGCTAECGAENWTLQTVEHKYIKVLKCGAGEGQLDRSCGRKKGLHRAKEGRGYMGKQKEG